MRNSTSLLGTLGLLAVAACSGAEATPDEVQTAAPMEDVVRTANPALRGYGPDEFPRIKELADDVYSYEQLRSAGEELFTTVSLFVVTDDGVLVADGQGSVEETQRMIDEIATVTDQPIRAVVVASDHGDHTAGNSAFPDSVAFFAHPTSAAALETMAANRGSDAPEVRLATEIVEQELTLEMGGKEIEILFLGRAHTGGDLVVHLPREKILFMSEAYLHRVFPAMRTAYPSEWVEMIERAQAMDIDTYVPGHGFVDSPAILEEELEVYRQAMITVIEQSSRLHAQGLSLEEAQAQAEWGDLATWSLSSSQANRSVQQVYSELNGELPAGAR